MKKITEWSKKDKNKTSPMSSRSPADLSSQNRKGSKRFNLDLAEMQKESFEVREVDNDLANSLELNNRKSFEHLYTLEEGTQVVTPKKGKNNIISPAEGMLTPNPKRKKLQDSDK